jgi:leucine dehydrogenase
MGTMPSLEDLIAAWPGESVVCSHHAPTGAWIFIAIHDTRPGPATGGTRMKSYPQPADGLLDAQRLAEGMTQKWRGIGIQRGGGKAVLAVPADLDPAGRADLLDRYAALIDSLGGLFQTGCDLGTTPDDMLRIARRTPFVHGVLAGGKALDPGPYTARGVRLGIEVALEAVFGSPDLARRTVLVEGLGAVGGPLAHELAERGARLLLADLDTARAEALAAELGATAIPANAVPTTACEVYAPCAVGGTVNAGTIPGLACRIVAGSANNQLGRPEDGELLHERGILYAPDFIINGGGALVFGTMDSTSPDPPSRDALTVVADRLREIFALARERDESTATTTRRLIGEPPA